MDKNIKLLITKKNTNNHYILETVNNNYIDYDNKINNTLIIFKKPDFLTINQLINKYKIYILSIIVIIFILFYLIKIGLLDFLKYT